MVWALEWAPSRRLPPSAAKQLTGAGLSRDPAIPRDIVHLIRRTCKSGIGIRTAQVRRDRPNLARKSSVNAEKRPFVSLTYTQNE